MNKLSKVIRVRLTEAQFDFLRNFADKHGTDLSAVIRDSIDELRSREVRKVGRPRNFSPSELRRVGIRIISQNPIFLQCARCGGKWSPNFQPGGRLPRRYWQCSNGCNAPRD